MPIYNPPVASGSGTGVTVDADGYITIDGYPEIPPFKPEIGVDEVAAGIDRLHVLVKHPTKGEVSVAFTDVPTA